MPATSLEVRERLVEALKLDLVGPWAGHALSEERLPGWANRSRALLRTGGEICEEALTHIENVIAMILAEMESGGVSPPPDEQVPGGILVTIEAG